MIKTLADLKKQSTGSCEGFFLISKIDFKPFKGKSGSFLSCILQDKSGSVMAVMWDGIEKVKPWLNNKTVVRITGEVSQYNDAPQVQIKTITQPEPEDYKDIAFVPSLDAMRINEMISDLRSIKDKIKNPKCKALWEEILSPPVLALFRACPGGVGDVHHNYCGGLVEHSYTMILMAQKLLQHHEQLSDDILLTGCLIHDIGKIWSYNWETALEMSDAGRLLHHTALGYGFLCRTLGNHDDPYSLQLAHIIISHHEDEGIRKPMTAEAQAVAMLDNLDASVMFALDFSSRPESAQGDSNWTKFSQLTERQYYIPIEEVIPESVA